MLNISNLKFFITLKRFRNFSHKVNIKLRVFIFPIFLAVVSSVFEGLSLALLGPFINGCMSMDFTFIREWFIYDYIAQFVTTGVGTRNSVVFIFLVFCIFFAVVIKNVAQYASNLSVNMYLRRFSDNLRRLVFSKYLLFGKRFYDKQSVGRLNQTIVGHINQISLSIQSLNRAGASLCYVIIYMMMFLYLSWQLTIFAVMMFPIYRLSTHWLTSRIKATSEYDVKSRNDLSKKTLDVISNMPIVKSFCAEEHEQKNFNAASNHVRNAEVSMDKKRLLILPLQEVLTMSIMLILLGAVAYLLVKQHSGSFANYMVYFFVLKRLLNEISYLATTKTQIVHVASPLNEVMRVLDDKGKPILKNGTIQFVQLKDRIDIKNLNFSYEEDVPIIRDINLSIKKGKMVAVVGPSGSGKSTLIHLLMRFYECPEKSIFVDGRDIRDINMVSLRRRMAWVSQDSMLFNGTLRSNIIYGHQTKPEDARVWDAIRRAQLNEFVSRLPDGLDTFVGDRGMRLSGGEKQRISIARAILKDPDILLLDEATSALDSATEKLIQKAIEELALNRTSIIIAHRLSTIQKADLVVLIENGRIAEQGGVQELIDKQGKFYRAWQAQIFD